MSENTNKIILEDDREETKATIKELYSLAKKQTPETFPAFMQNLIANYVYDYGTVTHAFAIAAIGAASAMDNCDIGGITGFQASFVMWNFIQEWLYSQNKCGMRLLNYDDMLYPQYAHKFKKAITQDVWDSLQEQAKKAIEEDDAQKEVVGEDGTVYPPLHANPKVRAHWESIVNGKVPFGYYVKGE